MDQAFSMTAEVRGKRLILTTVGYINNVGGEAIATEYAKHAASIDGLIINLAQSKVVNSIGMSFLLEIIEQLQENGGKMVFTNLDPAVEKMLAIMGIFEYASKAASVDAAVQLLG